jgi:hypothetical protein
MSFEFGVKPSARIDQKSVFEQAKVASAKLPEVNPNCEVKVVVPVYREFKGGRISDLLGDFEAQQIGSNRFEVVLVVNNPQPALSSPSFHGIVDNLQFLEYFAAQKNQGRFPNVHVLNCANGEIPVRHMGLVRGFGQLVAEDRLDKTKKGDKGVIVQLDADVSIKPDFLSKLTEAYRQPFVSSALIGRIPLPIDFKSDDYYLAYAKQFAEGVSSCLTGNFGMSSDGPTISFRAAMHKNSAVRNYMNYSQNEDFGIGRDLKEAGGMFLLADPRVYKADRIRADGFDSRQRDYWVFDFPKMKTTEILLNAIFQTNKISVSEYEYRSTQKIKFWEDVYDRLKKAKPKRALQLSEALKTEKTLAKQSLDWDNLDPQLATEANYLYAISRIILGKEGMMPFLKDKNPLSSKVSAFFKVLKSAF